MSEVPLNRQVGWDLHGPRGVARGEFISHKVFMKSFF